MRKLFLRDQNFYFSKHFVVASIILGFNASIKLKCVTIGLLNRAVTCGLVFARSAEIFQTKLPVFVLPLSVHAQRNIWIRQVQKLT